ncbi:MAG: hypothetical protein NTX76_03175 [Alphaproteobacteria bacterium]|nr:hypothetical protein [Alphaproteobacteria bacterium]
MRTSYGFLFLVAGFFVVSVGAGHSSDNSWEAYRDDYSDDYYDYKGRHRQNYMNKLDKKRKLHEKHEQKNPITAEIDVTVDSEQDISFRVHPAQLLQRQKNTKGGRHLKEELSITITLADGSRYAFDAREGGAIVNPFSFTSHGNKKKNRIQIHLEDKTSGGHILGAGKNRRKFAETKIERFSEVENYALEMEYDSLYKRFLPKVCS